MTAIGWIQIILFCAILVALVTPLKNGFKLQLPVAVALRELL